MHSGSCPADSCKTCLRLAQQEPARELPYDLEAEVALLFSAPIEDSHEDSMMPDVIRYLSTNKHLALPACWPVDWQFK